MHVPLFAKSDDKRPAINPVVAACSLGWAVKNSCTAPNGKDPFGNALTNGPSAMSTELQFKDLKP